MADNTTRNIWAYAEANQPRGVSHMEKCQALLHDYEETGYSSFLTAARVYFNREVQDLVHTRQRKEKERERHEAETQKDVLN